MSVFYSFLNTDILNCCQSWCWKVTSRQSVSYSEARRGSFSWKWFRPTSCGKQYLWFTCCKKIQYMHILFIEVYTEKCTFNKDAVRKTFPNWATHVTSIPTKRQHYQDILCVPFQSLQFSIKPLSQLPIISISFSCFDT